MSSKNRYIWVTREGERIAIDRMDNAHLVNACAMLTRDSNFAARRRDQFELMKNEIARRLFLRTMTTDEVPLGLVTEIPAGSELAFVEEKKRAWRVFRIRKLSREIRISTHSVQPSDTQYYVLGSATARITFEDGSGTTVNGSWTTAPYYSSPNQ